MESINIMTLSNLGFSLPEYKDGEIFILGDIVAIEPLCQSVNETILSGLDRSRSFYSYTLRAIEFPSELSNSFSFNVVCPIDNPVTGEAEYIVASINYYLLPIIITEIISEADAYLKAYYQEAILFEAASNPQLFKEAVHSVIVKPRPWVGEINPIQLEYPTPSSEFAPDDNQIYFAFPPENVQACHSQEANGSTPREKSGSLDKTKTENVAAKNYLRELSAKERQRIFAEIPDKATEKTLKDHPEAGMMLESAMANMTPEEALAILQYLISRHKAIGRVAVDIFINGTSKYQLVVVPRGTQTTRTYKDKAQYEMYLIAPNGKMKQVVFKFTVSYCIYMMHVIDRKTKGGDAKAIDLHACKSAFVDTYKAILSEETTQIESRYQNLYTRNYTKDGKDKERAGRYNDYIKDIHTTFENLLGYADSMPFKIGENRFLPLMPDNIKIPEDLAKLKIS